MATPVETAITVAVMEIVEATTAATATMAEIITPRAATTGGEAGEVHGKLAANEERWAVGCAEKARMTGTGGLHPGLNVLEVSNEGSEDRLHRAS